MFDTPTLKTCRTCGEAKPLTDFSITDKKRQYRFPHCKPCAAARKRAERAADPAAYNAYQRARYQANREYRVEQQRVLNKKHRDKIRSDILTALGGACERCGITDTRVLQIDHRYNNGGEHRKAVGVLKATRQIWHLCRDDPHSARFLYAALCANCHYLKTHGHL